MHCTDELTDLICSLVSDGLSFRQIAMREDMPAQSTLYEWQRNNPEFRSKCACAREAQADYMDDMIFSTGMACEESTAQSTKVKISMLQWRASKLAPKRYGDKTAVEHSNPDGTALAPPVFHVNFVKPGADNDA